MGFVVEDTNCEAYQVGRLYIADNSVHFNGLGGLILRSLKCLQHAPLISSPSNTLASLKPIN